MKFGYSPNIIRTFTPLPEPRLWFQNIDSQSITYFGSTNWTESYWKGLIYPLKTKSSDFLYHYSRFFDSIELNTTFYRIPSSEQVIKWKNSTPEGFIFCPKIPASISRSKLLGLNSQIWHDFAESMSFFEDQLGPCFMQLPEYFDTSRICQLQELMESNQIISPLMIELRHQSWFINTSTINELCIQLSQKQSGLVITDTAGRQDVIHMNITCPYLFIRFVSNGIPEYDELRLMNWCSTLEKLKDKGLKQIHFIFHHPNPHQMIACVKNMKKHHNVN
ncbi:MAG: DUF72 domain-containing protein [Saprospiraceae bacterium]